ncbi:MAG: hypothetical protein WAX69_06870 [Victivallales bacterium]
MERQRPAGNILMQRRLSQTRSFFLVRSLCVYGVRTGKSRDGRGSSEYGGFAETGILRFDIRLFSFTSYPAATPAPIPINRNK